MRICWVLAMLWPNRLLSKALPALSWATLMPCWVGSAGVCGTVVLASGVAGVFGAFGVVSPGWASAGGCVTAGGWAGPLSLSA